MFFKEVTVLLSVLVVINFASATAKLTDEEKFDRDLKLFGKFGEILKKEASSDLIEDFKKLPEYNKKSPDEIVKFIGELKKLIFAEIRRHEEIDDETLFDLEQALKNWDVTNSLLNNVSALAAKFKTQKISDKDFQNDFKKHLTGEMNYYANAIQGLRKQNI